MSYTITQIVSIIGASTKDLQSVASIDQLAYDSRKIIFPERTLFFALKTKTNDGHHFLQDAYAKGVRHFVVSETIDSSKFANAIFLQVENTMLALQALAAHHRKQFSIPVIGITGSNGKTIVKEWLYQLLHEDFNVVRSPKSYNSQLGVALSVWQMNITNNLAIFEAGISLPGEMESLAKIICPTIGIFTNIGEAHSENFSSMDEKIKAKLPLFNAYETLVFSKDQAKVSDAIFALRKSLPKPFQVFSWGHAADNDLQILKTEKTNAKTNVHGLYAGKNIYISFPYVDDASIENILHCWAVLLHLQIDQQLIADRMQSLQPVEMRLQLKHGMNGCTLINDSYSNDLNSLTIALDFLNQQQQLPNKTIVLSDMLQTGIDEKELYGRISILLQQKNIHRFIGIGHGIIENQNAFANIAKTEFYATVAAFKESFSNNHFRNEAILIKGARSFHLEQIENLLEQQVHQTVLEINLSHLAHNLKQYQQTVQPGTKLMAMVKAFSYGAGSAEIANVLQFNKVDYLAVAYADEGVSLRKAGIALPIMVMSPDVYSFQTMVEHHLEPELYSFEILEAFIHYLAQQAIPQFPVHIKLDTGMHRLGFAMDEVGKLCLLLQTNRQLIVQAVFSHLVGSDNPSLDDFTKKQGETFLLACQQIEKATGHSFIKHIANSAAIVRHPQLQMDMVRLGIGLYGVENVPHPKLQLLPVGVLKSTIAQIKHAPKGETVGYDRKAVMQQDAVIATIRIGYADGLPRSLSGGKGFAFINGLRAPFVGNVCMDMTMIDITNIDNVQVGDVVEIFGDNILVQEVAAQAGTIAYEILTGISQRVRRVYYES